ncbi:MAG: YdcF family protein [Flavobacteriales bacterium]|nr:YdcF family protein [Flavobacteriales bacterium]
MFARLLRRLLIAALLAGLLFTGLVIYCDQRVSRTAAPYVFDRVEDVPHHHVGLVLGTTHRARGGRPNLYFTHRMEAATALLAGGGVDFLLLSGDNRTQQYNEPMAMRKALLAAGVDSSRIVLDHAGLRTFDSVVRAREVFGQEGFVVISQRFHNERAVYIARYLGIDAVGFNAADVDRLYSLRTLLREKMARVKLFLDLWTGVQPRFLGDPVPIPTTVDSAIVR